MTMVATTIRSPVAIDDQERQQHEDRKVHLQRALRLVDVQRRHDHKRGGDKTAEQQAAADQRIKDMGQQHRSATNQHCLQPGAVPDGEPQRTQQAKPEYAQHGAIGMQVVRFKGQTFGNRFRHRQSSPRQADHIGRQRRPAG